MTAPLFAILAGLFFVFFGIERVASPDTFLWQSRWSINVIYTLHLITLGTVTMVMAGALYQVTSLVGGSLLPGGRGAVAFIYSCLATGALLFLLAMLNQSGG